MSSAILKNALELVDPTVKISSRKGKKVKKTSDLVPENQKLIFKYNQKGGKVNKVNLNPSKRKLTVTDARKTTQLKKQQLEKNLQKLKEVKKLCTINLDQKVTQQIIERATTKRPIRRKQKSKKDQPTAFTEEDFKKFEAEYFPD